MLAARTTILGCLALPLWMPSAIRPDRTVIVERCAGIRSGAAQARICPIMSTVCHETLPRCLRSTATKTHFTSVPRHAFSAGRIESSRQSISGKRFFGKLLGQSADDKLYKSHRDRGKVIWQSCHFYMARYTSVPTPFVICQIKNSVCQIICHAAKCFQRTGSAP